MNINDPVDFKSPNHKPWLLVILAAVAVAYFFLRDSSHKKAVQDRVDRSAAEFAVPERAVPTNTIASSAINRPVASNTVTVVDSRGLLDKARQLESKRKFIEARSQYLELLGMPIDEATRRQAESAIGKINLDLIMTPYAMPEKVEYIVKSGDSLDKIAKKLGTTVDLIAKSNNIKNPSRINVGDVLRVFTGKFNIKVSKSDIDLVVYMDGKFFKRYSVGTGKFGKTPVGTFKLVEKQKEPVWWHPSGKSYQFGEPENILGTRWMTLRATGDTPDIKGYGIHGTWLPDSIGKAESAGCVRMLNSDVEELYTYIPEGTIVEIVE